MANFAISFNNLGPGRVGTIYINPEKFPPPYNVCYRDRPLPLFHPAPADPSDLHNMFLHLRSPHGLLDFFQKMLDGLVALGRGYEARSIDYALMSTGRMPDVVVPTAVISAYGGAGKAEEALKTFSEMVSGGVPPNAFTYTLLIKGLARGGMVGEAGKYLLEMVTAGLKPDAETTVAVFEQFVKEGKMDEGRTVLAGLKDAGFVPNEMMVMKKLDETGPFYQGVVGLLFYSK